MRAVIQRTSQAIVRIDHKIHAQIGKGILLLLGIEASDTEKDVVWLSNKICNLRIFNDAQAVMNLSVKDIDGDIIVVSQFTLFAATKKGNRPSYIRAAKPGIAIPLYESFVRQISKDLGKKVQTGQFGAHMQLDFINEGPVTILIDTHNKE